MRYRELHEGYEKRITAYRSITVRAHGLTEYVTANKRRGTNVVYRERKPLKRVDRPLFINWVTVSLTGEYLEGYEPKPIQYDEEYHWRDRSKLDPVLASRNTMGVCLDHDDVDIDNVFQSKVRYPYDRILDSRKGQKFYHRPYCEIICGFFGVKII